MLINVLMVLLIKKKIVNIYSNYDNMIEHMNYEYYTIYDIMIFSVTKIPLDDLNKADFMNKVP